MRRLRVAAVLCAGLLAAGAQGATAEDTTFRFYWKDGLRADSADGNFKVKLGGRMHYDAAFFDADKSLEAANGSFDNGAELRRARFEIEADIYKRFFFKTQYDFVGGDANVKDMYMGVNGLPVVGTLKIGQFKEAFSIEELTSSKYMEFMERGLNNVFAPSRNPGIGFHNAVLDERMTYAAGIFMDGDDFGNSGGTEAWGTTARVTGLPWRASETQLLHLGVAMTWRKADDTVRFRQRPSSRIAPRVTDTGALVAEDWWAINPEASFLYGPFSAQAEYTLASVDSAASGNPDFSGYYVLAGYWLTGESRAYKAEDGEFSRVRPNRNFLADGGGAGAWQVVLRYDALDLDDGAVAGGEMRDVTVGLNWHWNPNMRVMFNYVNTDVENEGGANIFQTRFSIDF
jgi:phosphate-selective porin OprO/OprP